MKTHPAQRTPGPARQGVPASLFPEIAHAKKRAMLGAIAHCLSVKTACAQLGIPRKTHYVWSQTDPQYAAAVGQARALGAEWLEDLAIQRATAGEHPSDTLLIFLLKGALPDKYRDQQRRDERSDVSELLKAVLLELTDRSQARDVTPAADWAPISASANARGASKRGGHRRWLPSPCWSKKPSSPGSCTWWAPPSALR